MSIAIDDPKLEQCHPVFRRKAIALIRDLEGHDFNLRIVYTWRSKEEQAQLKKEGHTRVSFSYHNASTRDGKPDALAIDLIDRSIAYDSKHWAFREYVLKFANSARSHGLRSGIWFGLTNSEKGALSAALDRRDWAYGGRLGWDPMHAEIAGLTLKRVKRGERPS